MKICYYCMSKSEDDFKFCPLCGKAEDETVVAKHHLKPGTVLANRYLVGHVMGEGGFGITYVSMDERLDMKVAIKEYYPTGMVTRIDSRTVEETIAVDGNMMYKGGKDRFLQEAKVLAKFSGEPGIVSVHDLFAENNTAYIVMEFLEGETLKENLKRNGTKTASETVELMLPIMKTLAVVHKSKLIHRDISPDNIMLTSNGIKLLDFGAARYYVDNDNKSMSVLLKEGYAPEEQYRKRGEQGPWTDVYALCGTMYRCITGKVPLDAMQRLYEDEFKTPSQLGVTIDANIERAIVHGLALKKNDRIQSMEQLIEELHFVPEENPAAKVEEVPRPKNPDDSATVLAEPQKAATKPEVPSRAQIQPQKLVKEPAQPQAQIAQNQLVKGAVPNNQSEKPKQEVVVQKVKSDPRRAARIRESERILRETQNEIMNESIRDVERGKKIDLWEVLFVIGAIGALFIWALMTYLQ